MPDQFEQAHLQHLSAREIELRKQYEDAIQQITAALSQIAWDGENFEIKNYPQILSRINQVVNQLHGSIFTNVVNGITTSWNLSNYKNNILVDRRLAGKQIPATEGQILYDPNRDALQQFLTRKEKGLNLSDRVWNSLDGYKVEQETAIGVGLSEGKSAAEMARDMRKYLNEPDRLFRKVRTDSGELKLSRAARNYHPGQGVYRSSYQNALRLTATETNVAYRSADYERWQNIPFVTGIQINLSNNHPEFDICDTLKGKYPKDFKFTGWHPRCLCWQAAIQLSDADYEKYEDALLAGEEPPQSTQITEPPQAFDDYVEANQERIEGWKNQPYWYKDNKEYIDAAQQTEAEAEQVLVAEIMRKAKLSGAEVDGLGKEIAGKYGGTLTPINFKGKDSILRKVNDELGGDFSQLKDSVRNTVVVPYKDLENVVADLKKDPRFIRVKLQDGPEYYGYKGVITNVRTENGTIAEMQVNSPGMIYAKVSKADALHVMSEETYNRIAAETGLEGGLGHYYYEKIRVIDPQTASPEKLAERSRLIEESKKYYAKFYGY